MKRVSRSFKHESLQDGKSVKAIMQAITDGLAKGKIKLSDEDDEVVLKPEGLLHVRLSASQDGVDNRLTLRVNWRSDEDLPKKKPLKVSAK